VPIRTPRERDSRFGPRLVAKRQTRLAGLDQRILAMYTGGMTVRDIEAHLAELYGVRIGRDTISRVTDAVAADVAAWRSRPLDEIYAIVYLDALSVKVREDRSVKTAPAIWRSASRSRAPGRWTHAAGASGRRACCAGPLEQGRRRAALPLAANHRRPSAERVLDARHRVANPARAHVTPRRDLAPTDVSPSDRAA
jgi:Transposase, Mutator family